MAKLSLSQRFPMSFRVIMILAVVVAIPLTVWSTQNASTQTQQHAASPYCSAFMVRDCIYGCTPTLDGGVCNSALTAPSTTSSSYTSCKRWAIDGAYASFTVSITVSWSKVANATGYTVYWHDIDSSGNQIAYDSYNTTNLSKSFSLSIPLKSKFEWKVRAYNNYSTGPYTAYKQISFWCNYK